MLPLVPRIPMFGGKLAAKKKAEFASVTNNQHQSSKRHNDYRSSQLMYGGPVQRAIRADLLSLRQEFRKDLEEVWSPPSAQNAVVKRAPGRAFQIFKETFRRTKFGIIHTRCSPPRCDKEAYIQMIFSAVLDLLCMEYDENLCSPSLESETSKKCFVDRVFAVFALYALYETNPLPNFPLNVNILQKKSYNDLSASELKQILSVMPMGASSDQGGRRAFRRYFRAPIRISLDQYHCFIQLRDVSMAIMDLLSCHQLSFISDMAVDCVYLIDRLKESSLLLCEYAGPSSLEGLIGSEEYYHSAVLNENEKHATTSLDTTLFSSDLLTDKQIHEDIDEVLSISSFEELIAAHQQQYDRILGSLSLDINRYKSNSRPSLKLNSIENILKDIIQGRHQSQNRSNCSTIRQKLENAILRHSVQASDSHVNDYNKDQESFLADTSDFIRYRDGNSVEQDYEFILPSCLPIGVKAGIQKAFRKSQRMAVSSQHPRIFKPQPSARIFHRNENSGVNHNDWLFEDYIHDEIGKEYSDEESEPTAMEMDDLQGLSALDNLLSLVDDSRQKRVHSRTGSDEDYNSTSSNSEASLDSFGTGPGDKALEVLLAMPKVNASMEASDKRRTRNRVDLARPNARERKRKQVKSKKSSPPSMRMVGTKVQENRKRKKQKHHDEKSVQSSGSLSTKELRSTSAPGRNALHSLLSRVGTIPEGDEKYSSSASSKESSFSEDEDTIIGHGNNALNKLLSNII